jgi:hypothetical protein
MGASQTTGRLMFSVGRCAVAAAMLPWLAAFAAHAQPQGIERDIKAAPGKDVRVAVYTDIRPDCTSGPLPAIRLAAAPAHGMVTVKRGTLKATNVKQCLATEVPAFVVFYRAADKFDGADAFDLEINFGGGRKQLQHFRVSVSTSPAGGQGI